MYLLRLACVVANAYVEIYYRLILSTLLDYSYIHKASNTEIAWVFEDRKSVV